MPYHVEVHPRVEEYLSQAGLSDKARERLAEALISDLATAGDYFREHNHRFAPGWFWYDRVFLDQGQLQHFWFAVSDARAVVGVLSVGYVERRP